MHPVIARLNAQPNPWAIAQARLEDDEEVTEFLARVFLAPFDRGATNRFLRWLCVENPSGRSIAWIGHASGRLVAHDCWIPYRLWRNGSETRGYQQGLLVVEQGWRNQGVFLQLLDASVIGLGSMGNPLLYSMGQPPVVTRALCRYFRWQVALELVEHVLPLSVTAAVPLVPQGLRRLVAASSKRLARAWAGIVRLGLRDVIVRPVDHVDDRLKEFLEATCRQYAWAVNRDSRYLAWRYLRNPRHRYRLYVARSAERVCGFMVLRTNSMNQGVVTDLLVAPGARKAYAACLATAVHDLIREGVQSVRMYQHSDYWATPLLRVFLPIVRPNRMTLVVGRGDGDGKAPTGVERRLWHVCLGDLDDEGGQLEVSPEGRDVRASEPSSAG